MKILRGQTPLLKWMKTIFYLNHKSDLTQLNLKISNKGNLKEQEGNLFREKMGRQDQAEQHQIPLPQELKHTE